MIARFLVVLAVLFATTAAVAVLAPQLGQFIYLLATADTWVAVVPAVLGFTVALIAAFYIKGV